MQDYGGPELLAVADLDQRRVLRHYHRGRNSEELALIGEGLGVIAGRGGDHAAFLLLRRQLGQGVAGSALFKTAGAL